MTLLLTSTAYFIIAPFLILLWIAGDILYQRYFYYFVDVSRLKFHVYGVLAVFIALAWWAEAKAGERAFLAAQEGVEKLEARLNVVEARFDRAIGLGGR